MVTFDIQQKPDCTFVTIAGSLDTDAANDIDSEFDRLKASSLPIVIDCSHLEYIVSSGLRHLLSLYKATNAKGLTVTLLHVNETVMGILKITHFNRMFTIK